MFQKLKKKVFASVASLLCICSLFGVCAQTALLSPQALSVKAESVSKSATEESATEETATEESATEESATEESATEESATEESVSNSTTEESSDYETGYDSASESSGNDSMSEDSESSEGGYEEEIPDDEYESDVSLFEYENFLCENHGGYIEISWYSGEMTDVVIPSEIEGMPVTAIGDGAFSYSRLTSVTIPETVTSIGSRAFEGCSSLTSVTIPETVTSIGVRAFAICSNLTNILVAEKNAVYQNIDGNLYTKGGETLVQYVSGKAETEFSIPNGVTSIGDSAFYYCGNLTSVVISDGVTSIGSGAFAECYNLTGVVMPDSVTSIGNGAFSNCGNLTSVEIPKGVSRIGSSTFSNCSSLASVVIPDGVRSIGNGAFAECYDLTSVVIPDSVMSIEDGAFYYCDSLSSVVIPDNVTSIGQDAFYYCSSLTSLTIGNSVTRIGWSAFSNCSSLARVMIPDSVTSIESYAFYGCDTLTSVEIPADVTSMGDGVFASCYSLASILVNENNSFYQDIDGNLYTKDGETLVQYAIGRKGSAFSIPEGVTSVGGRAFAGCSNLTSVVIPESLTVLGGYAFSEMGSLINMEIPEWITNIEHGAFANCGKLESVVIPDSVTSIGGHAFSGCSSLTSVTIGNGVTDIGEYAFAHCDKLTNLAIPDSVTSIKWSAFSDCGSLTSIIIPDSVITIENEVFYGCYNLTIYCEADSFPKDWSGDWNPENCPVVWGYEIEEKKPLITIESKNLSYSDSLYILYAVSYSEFDESQNEVKMLFWDEPQTEYTVETAVRIVRAEYFTTVNGKECIVFYSRGIAAREMTDNIYCRAYAEIDGEVYYSEAEKFSVLDYVYTKRAEGELTELQENAFAKMLDYGGAMQELLDYKADRLANGTFYTVTLENGTVSDGFAWGRYALNETVTLTANPPSEEGKQFIEWVDADGNSVSNSETLTVTVSGDVSYVALYGRVGIKDEDNTGSDLEETPVSAFEYASDGSAVTITKYVGDYTDVVIPATIDGLPVTAIGEMAFFDQEEYMYSNLTNVVIPTSVTSIGMGAFGYCINLTNVVIPDSVTSIGAAAFCYCINLTSVVIPDNVGSIENNTFVYCINLTSVTIPNSVTSIGNGAFDSCGSLTSVVIPDSVTSVGESAFLDCSSLTIYCEAESQPSGWDENWNMDNYCPVVWDCNNNGVTTNECIYVTAGGVKYMLKDSVATVMRQSNNIEEVIIFDVIAYENRIYSVTSIVNNAFYGCDKLTSVVIGDRVTSIGNSAFYDCGTLTSLTIGCGIKTIGENAFSGCRIKNLYITDIASWCNISFGNGTANPLQNTDELYVNGKTTNKIVIPNDVTAVLDYAFYGCDNLTSVEIPDSVTSIGEYAFAYSSSLTSAEIPDSVTSIGGYAFYYCRVLTNVIIGNGVRSIGMGAFYGCHSLTSVVIPDSVTSIEEEAFRECGNLISVTIGNGVISIGSCAFYGCSSLTNVEIGDRVTNIGSQAFYGCYNLTNAIFKNPNGWCYDGWVELPEDPENPDAIVDTTIDSTALSDPETAAEYLTSTYCECDWIRSE